MTTPPTGRLRSTVSPRVARLVYGSETVCLEELDPISTVDLAHLVMLAEQGLLGRTRAAALVGCILELRAEDFASLAGLPAPRGTYLAYEQFLSERLGEDTGGRLHTGRSRNDLGATVTALRLREALLRLLTETARLAAVLLARARAHRDVLMPVYTHYQAAMPATYGWYLLGVCFALLRDLLSLQQVVGTLDRSPLGAGAVAGTDLAIEPARTAALLGFTAGPRHALDAVASRDAVLRALAAAAGIAVTVSRLAADLQLWSSAEFSMVTFPDRLVGGSSAMPQKRNAFLLEHLRARAATAIGAWTAVATTMRATPFTNSIEIGTHAAALGWPGLDAVLNGVCLAQTVVSGARPDAERMRQRAEHGLVGATALVNRLVLQGIPFRQAHSRVGDAVRVAVATGRLSLSLEAEAGAGPLGGEELSELVALSRFGGGPGDFAAGWDAARIELADLIDRRLAVRRRVFRAEQELATAVRALAGLGQPT